MSPTEQLDPAVALHGVGKSFPGVVAVSDVSLRIPPGEVHVFAGENGAGKSTLMKLIAQVEPPSTGHVELGGVRVEHHGPGAARRLGVSMVHQEFALAPDLSVAENLFIGHEPGRAGWISRSAERRAARELLAEVGLDIDPGRRVGQLSTAEQQRVELAKALAVQAKVLILDEPTATLTEGETAELFGIVRGLTAKGIAVLYISHRLDEIFEIGDRVTVMRDGAVVATRPVAELDEAQLVQLMVGRDVANLYPRTYNEPGPVRLSVSGLTRGDAVRDVSFEVRAGEIVGLAGLVGAGRTELARAVFGAELPDAGTITLDGKPLRIRGPADAIAAGIGYLTESRKTDGLALQLGVDKNITLANLPMRAGLIDLAAERRIAERERDGLRIRVPWVGRPVRQLSGGNQQKVILARWLEIGADVLFFDEPGRGMDVGAKSEMFQQMDSLAARGAAVVLISSYLPELLNMCDRILVMRGGRITGEVGRAEFSEERVVALATGARNVENGGKHG
ncbi:ribose transport system ATP-binding protein/rhamnose transport system ATP-binding protein [Saccharopolyspora antimicrobica]|uniref:Monosaccharide ABC transporter ATP-binding protein (CUT2 family) n=1 Tax=Saccharopolyspora antimicrobica TaxID=455193 RepID=A0A1I5HWF4_9PSEU|nr:sugar ABC transporter ATP-binding protein [Saccharopolyspora antimicrobica]RKT82297.1 monosaccharide ABC transporter ATP-binding protein (CUT2 family) [Saccharopolyspora antimicrobica]SFO52236.1 ribose transport system ATP-binding protein/rhamnose transport system ATP-binding protein [Saccharopolyspora antimicrobica]